MFTVEEYEKAIEDLKLGMTQLAPDGENCHICGDGGHQAWECHHNPLNHSKWFWDSMTEWRCFHCGQVFVDEEAAAEHFGERESSRPICEQLCSGFRVFPDGRECKGCLDCESANQSLHKDSASHCL